MARFHAIASGWLTSFDATLFSVWQPGAAWWQFPPKKKQDKKKNGLSSMKMCLIVFLVVGNMHQRFFRAGGDLT